MIKYLIPLLIASNIACGQTKEMFQCVQNCVIPLTYTYGVGDTTKLSLATATLIKKDIDSGEFKGSFKVLLLTNKHALPPYKLNRFVSIKISNQLNGDNSFSEIPIAIYDKQGRRLPYVYEDPNEDLAIIDITQYYKQYKLDYLTDYLIPYRGWRFPDEGHIRGQRIAAGTQVYFAGFPKNLYDKRNVSPIVRTGIAATSPTEDYYFNELVSSNSDILHGFLIDATVLGGSSGSLVYVGESWDLGYYRSLNVYILGIISSELTNKRNASEQLHLGMVISVKKIKQLIDSIQ